jgi:broad specificity phosphatase PhoE
MHKSFARSRFGLAALAILILTIGSGRAFPAADTAAHGPRIVMIIRHAEKPAGSGDPNLSPQGYQRADALAKVIPEHFPKPDFLIATMKSKGSNRPAETITPLSKAIDETIATTFKADDVAELAHEVLTDPKYDGKTLLIAWHHGKIPELAKALGVKNAPDKWNSEVFDRVWEITYQDGAATWQDLPQRALPGDSEK